MFALKFRVIWTLHDQRIPLTIDLGPRLHTIHSKLPSNMQSFALPLIQPLYPTDQDDQFIMHTTGSVNVSRESDVQQIQVLKYKRALKACIPCRNAKVCGEEGHGEHNNEGDRC